METQEIPQQRYLMHKKDLFASNAYRVHMTMLDKYNGQAENCNKDWRNGLAGWAAELGEKSM